MPFSGNLGFRDADLLITDEIFVNSYRTRPPKSAQSGYQGEKGNPLQAGPAAVAVQHAGSEKGSGTNSQMARRVLRTIGT
jgi:hypothetical protein